MQREREGTMSSDKERIHRWITQAELERMLADAYCKGAEAMREALAEMFDREAERWGDRLGGVIPKAHADAIRKMPLPEDKP